MYTGKHTHRLNSLAADSERKESTCFEMGNLWPGPHTRTHTRSRKCCESGLFLLSCCCCYSRRLTALHFARPASLCVCVRLAASVGKQRSFPPGLERPTPLPFPAPSHTQSAVYVHRAHTVLYVRPSAGGAAGLIM